MMEIFAHLRFEPRGASPVPAERRMRAGRRISLVAGVSRASMFLVAAPLWLAAALVAFAAIGLAATAQLLLAIADAFAPSRRPFERGGSPVQADQGNVVDLMHRLRSRTSPRLVSPGKQPFPTDPEAA